MKLLPAMKFVKDRRGGVAVLFALSIIPVVLAAGVAVDYTRAVRAKATMQQVLDSAALAVAASRETTKTALQKVATGYVSQQDWSRQIDTASGVNLSIEPNDTFTLTFGGTMETSFMKLAGIDTIAVNVRSQSTRAISGKTEIALVLDTTGSMSGSKIDALKSAATSMVNTIYADPGASTAVRFAVVPFAQYVNVGISRRNEPWMNVPFDSSATTNQCTTSKPLISKAGCTTTPQTCTGYNDGVPYSYDCSAETCTSYVYGPETTTCSLVSVSSNFHGCVGSRPTPYQLTDGDATVVRYPGFLNLTCAEELLPLTSDKSRILGKISSLTANGFTYIPSGLIWGFNVLSPGVPFSEGAAYDSGNRNPRKVLVLMTDGENTRSVQYPSGMHDGALDSTPNAYTSQICDNAKGVNIEIYTVAFQVTDSTTLSMLKACATNAAHAFNAADSTALMEAFAAIAKSLRTVRLTN